MSHFKLSIVWVICLLLTSFVTYSQTFKDTFPETNTDSLERLLSNKNFDDTTRLMNLIKLERTYMWKVSPKSLNYIDEIGKVAKRIKHSGAIAYWKFMRALILNADSRNIEAEKLIAEALNDAYLHNDLSAQINTYSYFSILYLSKDPNSNLSKFYLEKAKELLVKSNDIHDRMMFLMASITLEYYGLSRNDARLFSIVNQILTLYKNNPKLSYCKYWVKIMEADFFKYIGNHAKENTILKELAKDFQPDNLYLLTRVQLSLGDSYVSLNLFDKAIAEYKKGIEYFHKIPHFKVQPLVDKTNYQVLSYIFQNYRGVAIELNDFKTSNALADSIFKYQKLDNDDRNRKAILEIQARYNFQQNELEIKSLSTAKQLSQALQNELRNNILIEKQKVEALEYNRKIEQTEKELTLIKVNSEKEVALMRANKIEENNKRLINYVLGGFALCGVLIGLLLLLRFYYLKEKRVSGFRNQFYTVLTHDLRGSINSLTDMGTVMNYLIRNNKIEEIEKVANQIDWIGCHTSLLLNNMLDWGLSNAYNIDTSPQNIDLPMFIKEIYSHYEAAIKTKNIKIIFKFPAHLPLMVNPKCIEVIIRNLIGNAKVHTQEGGEIEFKIEEIGEQQVGIHIKDTGEGIPIEKLKFIQRVFDGEIKPGVGEQDLGLGIILMSNYAKRINGKLKVRSKVGVGSCFTLLIQR